MVVVHEKNSRGMVGLFADWRDITVSTDFEDATILGVILEVADILRLRRWTVFDAVSAWAFLFGGSCPENLS